MKKTEKTEKTRETTSQEKEVLEYLNILRDSGATNMYGATPYILDEFDVSKNEAMRLLQLWMQNFNEDGEYGQVKI